MIGSNPLDGPNTRLTYRTACVMRVIAAQPGLSNLQIGARAGITDQGQISKLLSRLAGLGVLQNTGPGQAKGLANAWQLTRRGRQLQRDIAREIGWPTEPPAG